METALQSLGEQLFLAWPDALPSAGATFRDYRPG
jgi:hypothetical protein